MDNTQVAAQGALLVNPLNQRSGNGIHNVNIRPVLNGYSIDVGCQTVVFRHGDEALMANELAAYIRDPKGTQDRYMGKPVELAYNPQ